MPYKIDTTTSYSRRQLDLECLQSMDEPYTSFVEVTPSVTYETPKIVSGAQKLAQRYAVLFTTIIGSDIIEPGFGTTLYDRLERGNFGSYADIVFMANVANSGARARIKEDDAHDGTYGSQPDDEKLDDSWISDVKVDSVNRRISIYASILTAAGESLTFVVPTEAGIY